MLRTLKLPRRWVRMESNQRDSSMSNLMAIASVGTQMAATIGFGVLIDWWLNTLPWITIVMAVLSFVIGVYQLIRFNQASRQKWPASYGFSFQVSLQLSSHSQLVNHNMELRSPSLGSFALYHSVSIGWTDGLPKTATILRFSANHRCRSMPAQCWRG